MDYEPNFSEYSYDELLDVEKHIDKEAYPERYAAVLKLINDPALLAASKINEIESKKINKYSTFWPRFWAGTIDGIIFMIILFLECLIFGVEYGAQDNFLQAINGVQISIYVIFMHGYFGQTLGKMLMEVKVLNHETETDIDMKQSLLRESVNLVLNVSWVLIILLVATTLEVTGTISVSLSYAVIGFGILAMVWGISEFITMLFNNKRRAIHDYIGKTVVVRT